MRGRCALLFVLMYIAGFSGAATAQNDDQKLCLAPDPDLSISRCTAMIQSGHETQQNLAVDGCQDPYFSGRRHEPAQ
jgi:hypothetical protein